MKIFMKNETSFNKVSQILKFKLLEGQLGLGSDEGRGKLR